MVNEVITGIQYGTVRTVDGVLVGFRYEPGRFLRDRGLVDTYYTINGEGAEMPLDAVNVALNRFPNVERVVEEDVEDLEELSGDESEIETPLFACLKCGRTDFVSNVGVAIHVRSAHPDSG